MEFAAGSGGSLDVRFWLCSGTDLLSALGGLFGGVDPKREDLLAPVWMAELVPG